MLEIKIKQYSISVLHLSPLLVWRILDDQGSQLGAETCSNFDSSQYQVLMVSVQVAILLYLINHSVLVKVSMATQYSAYKLEDLTGHVILS